MMKTFKNLLKKPSRTEEKPLPFPTEVMSFVSLTKFHDNPSQLKSEFDKKYQEDQVSGSAEKLKDFRFTTILGQGAFGIVVIYHVVATFPFSGFSLFQQKLVKHEPTEKFYAVKILKKDKIVKSKQVKHTLNEKKVLAAMKFQFVVRLEFSLKDNSYLYLGMGFVNGGEMFTVLRK
jgi:protein kinase A